MVPTFGELLHARRREADLSLREFAIRAEMDPGNLSKVERGRLDPPQDPAVLRKLSRALGYTEEDPRAVELGDLAAVQKGRIPPDIRADAEVMAQMPLLLRTVHDRHLTGVEVEKLIDMIRKA